MDGESQNLRLNRNSTAFTLVELLVVVAIVAILAALLLPVLSRGKSSAWRVECANNLRELRIAFEMYTMRASPPTSIAALVVTLPMINLSGR